MLLLLRIAIVLVGAGLISCVRPANDNSILNVGYPAEWGKDLIPALQHSIYTDALLSNEFEPLVSFGREGRILPLAAKKWHMTDNFKKFIFEIDTSKKFSDGTPLEAKYFKEAWEKGLSMAPISSNSSLLDALAKTKGFEKYRKTKKLDGVKVLSPARLSVEFSSPFRTALGYFGTTRMSVFRSNSQGKLMGTGPYVIKSISKNKLTLTKNKFFASQVGFESVNVRLIKPVDAESEILSGRIHLYAFAETTGLPCVGKKEWSCYTGPEARHSTFVLNSNKGRTFSEKKIRAALQFILHQSFKKIKTFIHDPQVFLPLQAGRLSDEEAVSIIEEGAKYVKDLALASERSPLKILASGGQSTVAIVEKVLEQQGIQFVPIKNVPVNVLLDDYYKNHKYDMILMTLSVNSGDPDGIYHALGKNGSIASPMMNRESSAPLLEYGRKILEQKKIHPHYQKVSRAILRDVPFFHASFLNTQIIYNKSKVRELKTLKHREDSRFSSFEPAE